MTPTTGTTMNSMLVYTSPMIMVTSLYKSSTGLLKRPAAVSSLLITPLSRRRMIHP